MAYKRQADRLPIITADARVHNVVCHYCIVGCGYKAYTWDIDKQGTTDPAGNCSGRISRNSRAPKRTPGTDFALFNAWLTYIAEKGWVDRAFIAASTTDFDKAVAANRTTPEEAACITGLIVDQIRQSAEWIAQPKRGGARRRTMFAYEKGLIWGNDNYPTNGALVNVVLATGNVGRPGGGCVRLGGHQEGYSRPSDAHVGRPAAYVDQLLIEGKGGVHQICGCDHYKTTLNALKFKQAYKRRTDLVKDAMSTVPWWGDRPAMVSAIMEAIRKGACSPWTSTSSRPRSVKPATCGCLRRPSAR